MATINSVNNRSSISNFTIGTGNLALSTTNSALTTGVININAVRFIHSFGTENTFLGASSGNGSLTVGNARFNVGIGTNSLQSLVTSAYNTAVGVNSSMFVSSSNSNNTSCGVNTLCNITSISGNNTAVGYSAGNSIVTGANNTLLGYSAGSSLTLADSSNIIIGNTGTVGDGNKIIIGTAGSGAGQQDNCFIAGITGNPHIDGGVSNFTFSNVQVDASDQLGTDEYIRFVNRPTTSAHVKAAWYTTRIVIFNAGAGKVIVPIIGATKLSYGGTSPFTGTGSLFFVNNTNMQAMSNATITQSQSMVEITNNILTAHRTIGAAANLEDEPTDFSSDAAITGNAEDNNVVYMTITYRIVSF